MPCSETCATALQVKEELSKNSKFCVQCRENAQDCDGKWPCSQCEKVGRRCKQIRDNDDNNVYVQYGLLQAVLPGPFLASVPATERWPGFPKPIFACTECKQSQTKCEGAFPCYRY
jgi:hypothetical protein